MCKIHPNVWLRYPALAGQADCRLPAWVRLLEMVGCLMIPACREAVTAALAADSPGGKLGSQFAVAFLSFLVGLARAGPPTAPSFESGDSDDERRWSTAAWQSAAELLKAELVQPFLLVALIRRATAQQLLPELAAMLGRMGQPSSATLPPATAQAQLPAAVAAFQLLSIALFAYKPALGSLERPSAVTSVGSPSSELSQQAQSQPAQQALLQVQCDSCSQTAWLVIEALAPAVAAMTALAPAAGEEALAGTQAVEAFRWLVQNPGNVRNPGELPCMVYACALTHVLPCP